MDSSFKAKLTQLRTVIDDMLEQGGNEMTTPKIDSQGRIISVPEKWDGEYYIITHDGFVKPRVFENHAKPKTIALGYGFICRTAAKHEATRCKFIQTLRGLDGCNEKESLYALRLPCGEYVWEASFVTEQQRLEAQKLLTPEIEEAFTYVYDASSEAVEGDK